MRHDNFIEFRKDLETTDSLCQKNMDYLITLGNEEEDKCILTLIKAMENLRGRIADYGEQLK